MIQDQQEQLSTDECVTVDGNDWIVIHGEYFKFPHETKVIMF